MILSVGADLCEIDRIEGVHARLGERFLDRILTADEKEYCLRKQQPWASVAARFAAKEAVMKCLGTGWTQGVTFRDIEVRRARGGAPGLLLHGRAAEHAAARGIACWHLSLSHSRGTALAMVVAEGTGTPA